MNEIPKGLDGVFCQMDDVLIFRSTQAEHDSRLIAVLNRIEAAGVTLNPEKCEFRKERVKFLCHIVDRDGIRADPDKVTAILQMGPLSSVPELRRFLGMAKAQLSQPLRELLSKKNSWVLGPAQEVAFNQIKADLTQPTVLTLYDPATPTKVSADASSYGLGAVLLQKSGEQWKPVAYASRSTTNTERRYAQVEKEALAVTWACNHFSDYILGRFFEIETDHKPLVPILNTKNLDKLPPRVVRFQLRLARFDYIVCHVPGKLLYTADALSRAPLNDVVDAVWFGKEADFFADQVVTSLPASVKRLREYKEGQDIDTECAKAKAYCLTDWPSRSELEPNLIPY